MEYIERLTNQKEVEWEEVKEYLFSKECRMKFLAEVLDDPTATDCGKCDNCLGKAILDTSFPKDKITEASEYLSQADIPLKPRAKIPHLAITNYAFGNRLFLARELRAEEEEY